MTAQSMGAALHRFLTELDEKGDAYTVSVGEGPHLGVLEHSPEALVQVQYGPHGGHTYLFINLNAVKAVEVEEC